MRSSVAALGFAPAFALAVALALALAVAMAPGAAPAATLAPGDLVVIDAPEWGASLPVLRVDPNTGVPIETISAGGLLVNPHALCVLPTGIIVVADRLAGLVRVDPSTGAQSVLVSPAGFGGAGPSGVAREASGDLLVVCGDANGIRRVSPTGALLGTFSPHGLLTAANGIAVAPDGRLWVADGYQGVVAVDPVSGAQTPLALSGVDFEWPDGIAIGKGGSPLYLVMGGRFAYHLYGGVYQVDPVSGAGTRVDLTYDWVEGTAVDPASGAVFVSTVYDIEHGTALFGQFVKGLSGAWAAIAPAGQRLSGPLAVVPPYDATPATPMTWGRLKAMMR